MAKNNIRISDHFTYERLIRFVLPSIGMMVFTSIYGVVDGFFVSNFVGKTAFAAVNLIMPFVMVLGGMGFMVGTGGTALVAKTLGEGEGERAEKLFSMIIYFTLILGAVLSALGVIFMRPVAEFFGATPEMLDDCVLYGRIVTGFTVTFSSRTYSRASLSPPKSPKWAFPSPLPQALRIWCWMRSLSARSAGASPGRLSPRG